MTFLIFALSFGILLGLFCHVLMLVPATLVISASCGLVAWYDGHAITSAGCLIMLSLVALQGGYMIGLTGRDLSVPNLLRSDNSSS